MTRLSRSLAIFALCVFVACADDPANSPDSATGIASAGETASCPDAVADIIESIYPTPGLRNSALARCADIVRQFDRGQIEAANAMLREFIEDALRHAAAGRLLDPPGPDTVDDALGDLIAALLAATGQTVDSGDVVVGTVDETSDEDLVNDNGTAGVEIEPGDLSGSATVAIFPLPNPTTAGECPFSSDPPNDCYPRFFDVSVEPAGSVADDVELALCVLDPPDPLAPPSQTVAARLQIASEHQGQLVFWPSAPGLGPAGVTCTAPSVLAPSGWQGEVWSAMGPLADLFSAAPLFADPGRLGASVSSFTPFAPTDPVVPLACPGSPDAVATDEATLLAAIAGASPGDVIAINGTVELTDDVVVDVADVTLTCASPGSGLTVETTAATNGDVIFLIRIQADGIRVERLELDGLGTVRAPVLASDPLGGQLTGVAMVENEVACGPDLCSFFVGVKEILVDQNVFSSTGSNTGVHVQGNGPLGPDGRYTITSDDSRIVGNYVSSNIVSGDPRFGGIRARDGSRIVIENNQVSGGWQNSVAVTEFVDGRVEGNVLSGADDHGILLSSNPFTAISTETSSFDRNRITGAGVAGIRADRACSNDFLQNDLSGNAGNLGIIFDPDTGDNFVNGTGGADVVDNGAFDCDGDSVNDPNTVVGGASTSTAPSSASAVLGAAAPSTPASHGVEGIELQ